MLERYDEVLQRMRDALSPIVPDGLNVVIVVGDPDKDVVAVSNCSREIQNKLCSQAILTDLMENKILRGAN